MEKAKKFIEEKFEINDKLLKTPYFKKIEKIYGKKEAKKQLEFYFNLTKHNLEDVSSICNWVKKQKYSRTHERLLGAKSKAMPDNIFKQLLKNTFDERLHLLFEYDGFEGPRPADAVLLKDTDLNFTEHTVTIYNSKSKRYYTLPLKPIVEKHLKEFIKKHHDEILEHNHYIFFSKPSAHRHCDHLSDRWVKNQIIEILNKLNLNKPYATSKDGRTLWLYGFHSLRGHAGTNVWNNSNHDIKEVGEVLDHSPKSVSETYLYIADDDEQLRKAM